ncbi:MAG: translation elongation factor Ts [Pseudomonadota bacterium]
MVDITASMVKDMREKSGAGMMDAKAALLANDGNMDAALDWLRAKGLAKAAKKSGRTAAEGLVAVAVDAKGTTGAVVEVNSETDFVARNETFQGFVRDVANLGLTVANDTAALADAPMGGKTVQETLTAMIATIGENMSLRRFQKLSVGQGVVASYVHNAVVPNLGKIGVLVALESAAPVEQLHTLGKQIAMHIAAANPECLDRSTVSADSVEREKAIFREQTKDSGKPAEIIEKMIEGRMRKYYEEICLTEQVFIMDGERTITQVVEAASKDFGTPVKLAGFARYLVGDGIEKEEVDFAAEVAATAAG